MPCGSEVPIKTRSHGTSSFSRSHTILPTRISCALIFKNKIINIKKIRPNVTHLLTNPIVYNNNKFKNELQEVLKASNISG